jgi:hypothetical protein
LEKVLLIYYYINSDGILTPHPNPLPKEREEKERIFDV